MKELIKLDQKIGNAKNQQEILENNENISAEEKADLTKHYQSLLSEYAEMREELINNFPVDYKEIK